LQGSRDHESLGRENWQTSTEKSFKVSQRERERSGFVASQYFWEFLRTEEWKKLPKHRERERGSAPSFVLGVG
jgi:hypothetical protein